ncbi:MAG: N-acetyltransferase [Bacteroidota bacterium]
MKINLRTETSDDLKAVKEILIAAFKDDPHGDQTEHLLVNRLRKSEAFVPQLSIVAEADNKIVGHILFTRIKITDGSQVHESLALAPVSVAPEWQGKGIGGQLIKEGHQRAINLGFKSVILLGHAGYYPRFGYRRASDFNIRLPFEVPDENSMAIELVEKGLSGVNGTVEYDKVFFE